MKGFSYRGIHSSSMNCFYVPDDEDRWFASPAFEVIDASVPHRHGGYYYWNRVKAREFVLECYFEEETINQREKIRRWLGRDTSGELIFDERPFVYYKVRPTKIVTGKLYPCGENLFSGTFTITFTAYNPFGYMEYNTYYGSSDAASSYCDILPFYMMPEEPTTESSSFLLYNCGSEKTPTIIEIGGSAPNGIEFKNETNNTSCKFTSLPNYDYLVANGEKGYVKRVNDDGEFNGFQYHDNGYIILEPNTTTIQGTYEKVGPNSVVVSGIDVTNNMVGMYFYHDSSWLEITGVNTVTSLIIVNGSISSETGNVIIASMNKITVSGSGYSLDRLYVDYTARLL